MAILIRPLNHLLREIRKCLPGLNFLPQVRLCEHSQRIPRNLPLPLRNLRPLHKMRHGSEIALRNELQRLPRLERQAVLGNIHLHNLTRPRLNIQPGFRIWRC